MGSTRILIADWCATSSASLASASLISAFFWAPGRSNGVRMLWLHMPCRSGLPSRVRGTFPVGYFAKLAFQS